MQTKAKSRLKAVSCKSGTALALVLVGGFSLFACTHREDTSAIPSSSSPDTPTAVETNQALSPGAVSDTDTLNQAPAGMGTTGTVGATKGTRETALPDEGSVAGNTDGSTSAATMGTTPSPTPSAAVTPPSPSGTITNPSSRTAASQPGSDNSGNNKRHTDVTAMDQSNDPKDLEITRQIRRSITGNDALSTYARNVKIITRNGNVVLKGPVRSLDEKEMVEETARKVAGNTQVSSEITISPQ